MLAGGRGNLFSRPSEPFQAIPTLMEKDSCMVWDPPQIHFPAALTLCSLSSKEHRARTLFQVKSLKWNTDRVAWKNGRRLGAQGKAVEGGASGGSGMGRRAGISCRSQGKGIPVLSSPRDFVMCLAMPPCCQLYKAPGAIGTVSERINCLGA